MKENPIEEEIAEEIDYSATDFYLKIYMDFLDVTYKLCDDFGAVFKPYVLITIPGNDPVKIPIYNIDEEKLNISDMGLNESQNTSLNLSTSNIMGTQGSVYLNNNNNAEKKYLYKTMKNFFIKKENYYSAILIQIKNEQSNNTKKHQIIIGETKLQVNLLVQGKDKKDLCFDGYVKVMLRNSITIGRLRLNINFSLYPNLIADNDKKIFVRNITK